MTHNGSEKQHLIDKTELALHYLERLSADSVWAHRASGLRGSLWQALQVSVDQRDEAFFSRLSDRLELAFWMLKQAALEIPVPDQERLGLNFDE